MLEDLTEQRLVDFFNSFGHYGVPGSVWIFDFAIGIEEGRDASCG